MGDFNAARGNVAAEQRALTEVFSEVWYRVADATAKIEDLCRTKGLGLNQSREIGDLVFGEILRGFARNSHIHRVLVVVFVSKQVEFCAKLLLTVVVDERFFHAITPIVVSVEA